MLQIVLFGKPGAGKGTQALFLKEKYSLVHLSTGDIFRYNIKKETSLGKLAKSYIDRGDLVPDAVTVDMLREEVKRESSAKGFIFDGFPRTISQAEALDVFLKSNNTEITATIALEAEESILIERLINRGKTSARIDDQDESKIKNRFEEYNKKTKPLLDFYQKQGKLYRLNGVGKIKVISHQLTQIIDELER